MKKTHLHIKNMVCNRCIKVVKEDLEKLGLNVQEVKLGEAVVDDDLDNAKLEEVRDVLEEDGFELLDNKKAQLVEKIKNVIIDIIHHHKEETPHYNFSHIIAEKLDMDYNYLSNLFSSMESTTIEKFIIAQRIEKVKELLVYDELSLSEIAYKLGYSSVHHLSAQFKKVTGLTPTHFKAVKEEKRKTLDQVK
jgi:AraC family transcriptional regulator